jgi:abhydrolase domain-containing protein 13
MPRLLDPLGLSAFMPRWAAAAVQGVAFLSVGLLTALYAFQEKILYVPIIPGLPNTYEDTPADHGLQYNDEWITAIDGTRLQCWFICSPSGHAADRKPPVLLFFQENAGNMSHRSHFLAALARHLRCAIFVLGYRGYGRSQGSPGQNGLEMDADAALAHVLSRADVDTRRIVLLGRSLGGAVALHLAARAEKSIRAAIVENTFTSVEDMVPRVLPFLGPLVGERKPMNWLVRNKWRNVDRVREIMATPLLLIGSTNVRCREGENFR